MLNTSSYYDQGYRDGLAKAGDKLATGKAHIAYVYHQHKDASGTVRSSDYHSSVSGGCFTSYQPIDETIQVRRGRVAYDPGCNQDNSWGNCPRCGEIYTGWKRPGQSWDSDYVSHTHTIGYAYGVGCGKTNRTIKSGYIVWD